MESRRLFLALSLAFLASCSSGPATFHSVATRSFEKAGPHFSLKLQYPEIAGAPGDLNQLLADNALARLQDVEDNPLPFDDYARNIAEDSAVTALHAESILTIAHRTPEFLTTRCLTSEGAFYDVYDARTGRHLEPDDLLEDGKHHALPDPGPAEPSIGLLPDHAVCNGVDIPYDRLRGILKPRFLPAHVY